MAAGVIEPSSAGEKQVGRFFRDAELVTWVF